MFSNSRRIWPQENQRSFEFHQKRRSIIKIKRSLLLDNFETFLKKRRKMIFRQESLMILLIRRCSTTGYSTRFFKKMKIKMQSKRIKIEYLQVWSISRPDKIKSDEQLNESKMLRNNILIRRNTLKISWRYFLSSIWEESIFSKISTKEETSFK